ncbi:MAG: DUF4856 domain-containing protein [Oligoflexia bacterium]|nr:DUF4856 domain-containing protein [Oligoflexia bacterium]
MKSIAITTALLGGLVSTQASEYQAARNTLKNAPQEIKNIIANANSTYNFASQFNRASSVSYTGQIFRQVLISDIKAVMASQPRGSYNGSEENAYNMLLSHYAYNENTDLVGTGVIDGLSEFKVSAKLMNGTPAEFSEGFVYADIQSPGKNLSGKIAGVDNPLRRGKLYGTTRAQTPDGLIKSYFNEFATNAVTGAAFTVPNGSYSPQTITLSNVTDYGVDLAQLTQKFLHGAVSYSQAARDYLSTDLSPKKGLNADNTKPAKQGASYTALEHHFDEAFGYFGAARDYAAYTDAQTRSKKSIDSNNDGFISMLSEKTIGIAMNAAKIDFAARDGKVNFSKEAIDAFLAGRTLITQKPAGYIDYVVANARVALGAWEKTIAAVVVHYINWTIGEYDEYGQEGYLYTNFVKFWSEMKGYAFAFQFNPKGIMTDSQFDELHALMGEAPVLPHSNKSKVEAYKAKLLKARNLLQEVYNFSDENTQNW